MGRVRHVARAFLSNLHDGVDKVLGKDLFRIALGCGWYLAMMRLAIVAGVQCPGDRVRFHVAFLTNSLSYAELAQLGAQAALAPAVLVAVKALGMTTRARIGVCLDSAHTPILEVCAGSVMLTKCFIALAFYCRAYDSMMLRVMRCAIILVTSAKCP